MYDSLTAREYTSWQRYWEEEPWGPWRDNMHAAIIAREVRRPQLKSGAQNGLDAFIMKSVKTRQKEVAAQVWTMLKTIARKVKRQ